MHKLVQNVYHTHTCTIQVRPHKNRLGHIFNSRKNWQPEAATGPAHIRPKITMHTLRIQYTLLRELNWCKFCRIVQWLSVQEEGEVY